jgi:hypothetical protein
VPAWDVPAAHRVHALWPVEEYVPVGQEEQVVNALALVYVPAEQDGHDVLLTK